MPHNLQQFKKKAFAKPGVRTVYDELAEEFAFLDEVFKPRTKTGLTRAEVAERMGTTQFAVARLRRRHESEPQRSDLRGLDL